jgi:hypothetical protein
LTVRSHLGVLLLAATAAMPLAALEFLGGTSSRATMHVLSVGVEDYANRALVQVNAVASAHAFADSMRALGEGLFDVRVRVLAGPAATRQALVAVMDSLRGESRVNDLLVLYYRGLSSSRFLVLADTAPMPRPPATPGAQPPPAFEARLLRASFFGEWLALMPARQMLLVLESPDAAGFFHAARESLAAPEGALRATRDLAVLATPGSPSGVLTTAVLSSLGEERRAQTITLGSTLAQRVLDKLDAPIVVHQAGADVVLGAAPTAHARVIAAAVRDTMPWIACAGENLEIVAVANTYTLVGRAKQTAGDAMLFVNGRRARREGERFEVELPPAALERPVQVRVLTANGTRCESTLGLR